MKKTFYVNFSGYVLVSAETKEEAEKLFWEKFVYQTVSNDDCYDDVWDIEDIEEDSNGES